MIDFYREAELLHNDRVREQQKERENLTKQAHQEYSKFCVWCRMMNLDPTDKNLKNYLKEENVKLNFWVVKKMLEVFFNYEYKFDYDSKKWLAKKIAK